MIHIPGAFVLGTLLGTGLGMLIAPEKGSTTRNTIKKEGKAVKEKLVDDLKDVKDDLDKALHSGKEKLDSERAKFNQQTQDLKVKASQKAEKAITFLERQLAILKEKNKTYQTN